MMAAYVQQLECLNCSQSRSFVLHGDRDQRTIGQDDAIRQARAAVLTCARCGSSSLIRSWGDAVPYALAGRTRRRKRAIPVIKVAQEG
jgi:hypothetical protein